MSPTALIFTYCTLIMFASLFGGWVPLLIRLNHTRMQVAVSLVAGFMLGIGLLHLLPHALLPGVSVQTVVGWLLVGFLAMFFIERFFCFHHHDAPAPVDNGHSHQAQELAEHHHHDHRLTWSGAMVGLSLHSIIIGIAMAASIQAESSPEEKVRFAGLPVFLVIILHKPFDSMTLGTLMAVGGWKSSRRHLVNVLFALAVPFGVLLFQFGVGAGLPNQQSLVLGCALAFCSGTFLCISMSDLLPELQFHQHDRFKLSFALLAGLALAWLVSTMESHAHSHEIQKSKNSTLTVIAEPYVKYLSPLSPVHRSPGR